MKKKLFTLLAALLCGTFTSFAQHAAKTKRLTAKAGITYPMIHDMDVRGSQGTKSQGRVERRNHTSTLLRNRAGITKDRYRGS